jgi:hypothetical protein
LITSGAPPSIERLACRRSDPVLAHAILLDIAPLDALESDADAAGKRRLVIKGARRVDAQSVGRKVVHAVGLL